MRTVSRLSSSHALADSGMNGTSVRRKTKNGKIANSHAYASADAHMKTLSSPHCCHTRLHKPIKPIRRKTGERSRRRAMRWNVTRGSRKLPAPPQHPLGAEGEKDKPGLKRKIVLVIPGRIFSECGECGAREARQRHRILCGWLSRRLRADQLIDERRQ